MTTSSVTAKSLRCDTAASLAHHLDDDLYRTIDCDEDADIVTHTPDASACDDALFCNGQELCDATRLHPWRTTTLDDDFECTIDACDEDADIVSHRSRCLCKRRPLRHRHLAHRRLRDEHDLGAGQRPRRGGRQ